jgi:hypothetical protein
MTLDIHGILKKLDQGDMNVYRDASKVPSAKKELDKNASWLIPQWLTGSPNETDHRNKVVMFDQICNPNWSSLYHYPELQTKLMAVIGTGSVQHKFYRPTAKRASNVSELLPLLQMFYEDIRAEEVVLYFTNSDIKDLEELMDNAGIPIEGRSKICKQYKNIMK